ncbi:pantoate--beta-alanine ligase [Alicyclobacillus mengziensis]|uniref:Pantothenate synthetase n=1 Tax=Alicyclobacillus mengziensis TaxID=2931921 RepID=A0A9X7Z7A3_9BACL|nr:pantoate--beta-alanine ligase [Alicyclobacillus mengziensis]QSO47013.1 pantoate--beta-alanine ligase [Alicyclobacillus mengziensis]
MYTIETIDELRQYIKNVRQSGKTIGYVATMGYLHEGHLSLVQAARAQSDIVVVSIFVNPLQFGPNEDYEDYPRDLKKDQQLLENSGCDVLFAPSVSEMYPREMATFVELPELSNKLCGRTRPIHFRGVATVVCKLLNIVQPDAAYFGQKDGQQVAVIRRMVDDLNLPVRIVSVPIVREADGLAKSSRNIYLTEAERPHATVLYRALRAAADEIVAGDRSVEAIIQRMADTISAEPGVRLDYAEMVDTATLQRPDTIEGDLMLAVAAFIGRARLIDNIPMQVEGNRVRLL